jgi:hypothetical protein
MLGLRFGRLTVMNRGEKTGRHRGAYWSCQCDCGNCITVRGDLLKRGNTKSCGCLHDELCAKRLTKHGLYHKYNRLYNIWSQMLQRCENKKNTNYRWYGGRGIIVCAEWHTFPSFYKWAIANGYTDSLSIDRINNDGNYEPSNCRWATTKTQHRNTSRNSCLSINGVSKLLCEWSEEKGILTSTIIHRIEKGWTAERASIHHRAGKIHCGLL